MVHALTQAHRVLRAGGYVLDYRPDRDPGGRRVKQLDVSCDAGDREMPAGMLKETARFYADYVASDRAVERVLRQGFFDLVASEVVRPRIYFRTLDTLDKHLAEQWRGTVLEAPTRGRLRRILGEHPHARIVVTEIFRVNVLRRRSVSRLS